jgi:hypothetical protein
MSKRTRLFVVGALSILVIGVGTAGLASYAGLNAVNFLARAATTDLRYVPGTAQFVAYADVRRVMDSGLRHQLVPSLDSSSADKNPLQQIGLDLERDVDTVLVASLPGGARPEGMPLLLAHGRFDTGRIEAEIRNKGGAATTYMGTRFVANDRIAAAFIAPGFIAVGDPASVQLALDTKAGNAVAISSDATLMRLVGRVDDANTWVVADFQALQAAKSLPGGVAGQLPAITWLAASGDVGDGFAARIFAEGRDQEAAKDLQEVVRGFVALARMQAGQEAAMSELLNSIELTGEGNTVTLSFAVPASFFERLKKSGTLPLPTPASPGAAGRRTPPRIAA